MVSIINMAACLGTRAFSVFTYGPSFRNSGPSTKLFLLFTMIFSMDLSKNHKLDTNSIIINGLTSVQTWMFQIRKETRTFAGRTGFSGVMK